jgi:hypothetical protein
MYNVGKVAELLINFKKGKGDSIMHTRVSTPKFHRQYNYKVTKNIHVAFLAI